MVRRRHTGEPRLPSESEKAEVATTANGRGPAPAVASSPASSDARRRVGQELHSARDHQGLLLPQIARALHIPLKTLEAIERGTETDLPADIYARGFIKSYAEYLGLDASLLLREFAKGQNPTSVPRTGSLRPLLFRRPLRRSRIHLPPRAAAVVLGALLLVIALLYLFFEVRGFTRAPHLEISDPPGNTEIQASTLIVRGTTDPTAEVHINGEQTFVQGNGTFEETVGVRDGVNAIRVTATSVGGKERTVTRDVLVHLSSSASLPPKGGSASPLRATTTEPGDPFRLRVLADGEPVWLSLMVEGKTIFAGILLSGSEQTVEGKEVRVTSGKGVRTRLWIDDEDRGTLSSAPGVVRDIVFTRIVCADSSSRGSAPRTEVRAAGETCASTPPGFTRPSPSATVE